MSDSGPNRGRAAVDRSRAPSTTEMAAGTPPDTDPRTGPDLSVPQQSLADWFAEQAASAATGTAVRERRAGRTYVQSYEQLETDARRVASRLIDRGVETGTPVVISAPSAIATSTLFLAVQFAGAIAVPVGTRTETEQSVILDRIDPTHFLAVDTGEPPIQVDETISVTISETGRVVVPATETEYSFPGLDRASDDIAAIFSTAGTADEPTVPALTSGNLLAGATMLEQRLSLESRDVLAAVLPPNHVLSSVASLACWAAGGTTTAVSITTLPTDLRHATPTRLLTVPRLCRRLYHTVERLREGAGAILSRVLRWADGLAREYGAACAGEGGVGYRMRARHALANRLVFAPLRRRLGLHRVSEIVAVGGPVDPELQTVFRGMGVPLLSGYGTTETSGVATLPAPEDIEDGTVGPPLPGCTTRLADDGEVLLAGPQVIDQYWRDETTTRGAIIDGWFHTGDLGHWHEDSLGMIDRKAAMQTLENNTPVSPVRVERALRRSPVVADAIAIADDRPHVTALLQPAFEVLVAWADRTGVSLDRIERDEAGTVVSIAEAALEQQAVRDRFDTAVSDANDHLNEHETVQAFGTLGRPLSLENGELTPLLEKRRDRIRARFSREIEGLYDSSRS